MTEQTGKEADSGQSRTPLAVMGLAALGIVYGDIGTSPLYAFKQSFAHGSGIDPTAGNVMGVVSLIFWSLILVVTIKYLGFVMRADNRGEGGIMALVALLRVRTKNPKVMAATVMLGIFGAALLYGDGTITPAISVLSAVEGLAIATPLFGPYVVPITVVVLVALFMAQQRGTAGIGATFGPVMLLWFAVLGAMGINGIVQHPAVMEAIDPQYAVAFFVDNGFAGFVVLGTVFLAVTGAEALYADMGHFGRKPIRLAWLCVALPGLVLNYFGQAAILLDQPKLGDHTFYSLAPEWALYPLVILATAATVIASQAIVTGAFSLTHQAIQLGFLPRMQVVHTHGEAEGQIHMPAVNWMLMIATLGLVLGFKTSGNLSSAYGLAVSLDMVFTTLLAAIVAIKWGWHPVLVILLTLIALTIDLAFFGANSLKIAEGGWYPMGVAVVLFVVMTTWRRGRLLLLDRLSSTDTTVEEALENAVEEGLPRVPGTAVFLAAGQDSGLRTWLHHVGRNRVLHEHIVFLSVRTTNEPRVGTAGRLEIKDLGHGASRVIVRYGFMQSPDVPVALRLCERAGLAIDLDDTIYFMGRTTIVPERKHAAMMIWRQALFAFLTRNAVRPADYFRVPPDRVMELGLRIEM